jgi:cytochrome c553
VTCHIDANGRGTFELPLSEVVLGTTIQTGSIPAATGLTRKIDVDPFNDVKITPTAAVCSSCHDKREDRSHMIRNGASFSTTQEGILPGGERCVNCHGRGREKDVRRMHEIQSSTRSRD